jgi:hypothetical protein
MKSTGRILAVVAFCSLGVGCSRGHRAAHPEVSPVAEPASPTPDTTPVAALRTPAGLVLGIEGTPAPAAPTPATTSVPQTTTTPGP